MTHFNNYLLCYFSSSTITFNLNLRYLLIMKYFSSWHTVFIFIRIWSDGIQNILAQWLQRLQVSSFIFITLFRKVLYLNFMFHEPDWQKFVIIIFQHSTMLQAPKGSGDGLRWTFFRSYSEGRRLAIKNWRCMMCKTNVQVMRICGW